MEIKLDFINYRGLIMNCESKNVFSFKDIVKWTDEGKFSLPTVQRGFVWRPYQIENLWDSILRGYPIGAIVLSEKKDEKNGKKYEILDGQQRLTAICLGFNKNFIRKNNNNFRVFIDLYPDKKSDRKYIFRVITKSHPWGYQKVDNTKPLSSENKRKAMELFPENFDISALKNLDNCFPYDAVLPVPFNYFIEDNVTVEIIRAKLDSWFEKITKYEGEDAKKEDAKKKYENEFNENMNDKIKLILEIVNNRLFVDESQKLPAIYLNLDKFEENNVYENTNLNSDDEDDEIERLFIRLNSGGTTLVGEELNYSILKSKIDSNIQDKIEEFCGKNIRPARFITLAYRLYLNRKKDEEFIKVRIKPRQFQRAMLNFDNKNDNPIEEKDDFKTFLEINILDKKNYNERNLLEYTISILEYRSKEQEYGLPYPIVRKIADSSPEIMFLLLYRICIMEDRFSTDNVDLHKKMLGMITMFLWFGKDLRGHSKLLSKIWDTARTEENTKKFWSMETVRVAMMEDDNILIKIPKLDNTIDLTKYETIKEFNLIKNEIEYATFSKKFIYNRDLILYAQREFLNDFFTQDDFNSDDTDVPFDWDHISPYKLVHYITINSEFKSWYSTIGNFRAWPYSLNRMDQAETPATKLNPNLNDENKRKWERFIESKKDIIKSDDDISKKLLKWSFCEEVWAKCKIDTLKTPANQKEVSPLSANQTEVYQLIKNRIYLILIEWYQTLKIDSLIPEVTKKK